jgi:anaerobic selenocysteine-containing dehydrogenase
MTEKVSARESEERVIRTVCKDCHVACGVLVHVRDGKITFVEGDPEHPLNQGVMCPKGLSIKQQVYHPNRIVHPMKRVGERGEGKWQRISWDEALDTITSKLKETIEKYGPNAIYASVGGKPSKNMRAWYGVVNSLGSPNVGWTDAPFCFGPFPISAVYTYGGFISWEMGADVKNTDCVMVWGGHPAYSHPTWGRLFMQARERGARTIVVDPRYSPLASKADLWLQLRPGTDAALALGMINVIINEELYDNEFVGRWCIGFDEIKEHVQEYSPDRVAEITWLAKEDIIKAARWISTIKPACIYGRAALEMLGNAVQSLRAIAIIRALIGCIDVKGGNVFDCFPPDFIGHVYLWLPENRMSPEVEEQRIGATQYPLLSGPNAPLGSPHTNTVIDTILTDKPYPIKVWFISNDVAICVPDTRKVIKALKKVDFLVVTEFFKTVTAEYADILLPAATWIETDDIESCYTNLIVCRQRAIEPVGECWDEMKLMFEILKRMGAKYNAFPDCTTMEETYDIRLKGLGMTFEDLKQKHIIEIPMEYKKYERTGFHTPSGKVELFSQTLKDFGYDPLPYYVEPVPSYISTPEIAEEYPLMLITCGLKVGYMHSMGRNIPWLRELVPEPEMEIHPDAAKELGIEEADLVWIEVANGPGGRVRSKAKLTRGVHPKMVQYMAHWWLPEKPGPDYGQSEVNINMILPNDPVDPIAGTPPLTGLLCKIYKAGRD